MPTLAKAPSAARRSPEVAPRTNVETVIAAVAQAGRIIVDLRTQLAEAEQTIADLRRDKRAMLAELRGLTQNFAECPLPDPVDPMPRLGPLDDALSAVLDGFPAIARAAPTGRGPARSRPVIPSRR